MTANTVDSRRRRRLQSCITQLNPPPRFDQLSESSLFLDSTFSIPVHGCEMATLKKEFAQLNSDQKGAITKVISARDFALIQGLPGTGKSATVSFLTRLLVAQGKRVLLTSYTHSAVDNLFCKLLDSGLSASNSIVRIGRESSCHPRVHSTLAQNIACMAEAESSINTAELIKTPNVNFLYSVVSSARIIGVTALTAPKSPLLSGQHFDYVIVDEAGQINQPAILGAITSAEKFVLVGDHMQLPPLARSQIAEQAGKVLL
jgi:DNA replication ATP-dependent helicase Dna2